MPCGMCTCSLWNLLSEQDEPDYQFLHGCLDRLAVASPVYKPLVAENTAIDSVAQTGSLMSAQDAFPTYPQSGADVTTTAAALILSSGNLASVVATSIPSFTSAPLYSAAQDALLMQVPAFSHGYDGIYEGLASVIADTPRSPPEEGAHTAPPPLNSTFAMQLPVLRPLTLPAPAKLPPPAGFAPVLESASVRDSRAWGPSRAGVEAPPALHVHSHAVDPLPHALP